MSDSSLNTIDHAYKVAIRCFLIGAAAALLCSLSGEVAGWSVLEELGELLAAFFGTGCALTWILRAVGRWIAKRSTAAPVVGACQSCGYDRRATPLVCCPECGDMRPPHGPFVPVLADPGPPTVTTRPHAEMLARSTMRWMIGTALVPMIAVTSVTMTAPQRGTVGDITLMILAATTALPFLLVSMIFWRTRQRYALNRSAGHCRRCGYDRRATLTTPCPECNCSDPPAD